MENKVTELQSSSGIKKETIQIWDMVVSPVLWCVCAAAVLKCALASP